MWLKANRSPAGARNLTLRCVGSASTRSLRVGGGGLGTAFPAYALSSQASTANSSGGME